MNIVATSTVLATVCLSSLSVAQTARPLDAARIDAALGRSGAWVQGVYVVDFPRPDLRVMLDGVRLSTMQVLSFATFVGTDDAAEMMGEICALPNEVTPAIARLRAGGLTITAVHNHFLGESPRLTFIHFTSRGPAAGLARAYRAALAATTTPLGKPAAVADRPEPAWAHDVERAMGRPAQYWPADGTLEVDVMSAHFAPGPMDYWYESPLFFQAAPRGRIAATGDIMVTAEELDPVLSALLAHGFRIEGVHNHMLTERPRVFFVHFWKIAGARDLADGLNATLAKIAARGP